MYYAPIMKFGWFNRFGATAVFTLTLVLFLLAFSSSSYTLNIRAASGETLPSATPNFTFPSCRSYLGIPGDHAHYTSGLHQIVAGPLLLGSDDVYTLEAGNFLQCFCPTVGNDGIQTNWLRSDDPIVGWFFEHGAQWNLGDFTYAAQNISFQCGQDEPSPTPTLAPTAVPTDSGITVVHDGKGDGLGCAVNDCSGNTVAPAIEGFGTGGQILGASTMAGTGTFEESFYQAIMSVGATLSAFGIKGLKKGKKVSKK